MIDMVIFRLPSEASYSGEVVLVSVPVIDGELGEEVTPFTVDETSSYNELELNQIVLASAIEGGSEEYGRYAIRLKDGSPQHICSMQRVQIAGLVAGIVADETNYAQHTVH